MAQAKQKTTAQKAKSSNKATKSSGANKSSASKKNTKTKKMVMRAVKGIIFLLIGIFLFLCLSTTAMGKAGEWIKMVLTGVFGISAIIVTILSSILEYY